MKKALFIAISALLIVACAPKPATIKGVIKDYDGSISSLSLFVSGDGGYLNDSIVVNTDGTFAYEKVIDHPYTGFISLGRPGSEWLVFLPEQAYYYEIEMNAKPSVWTYTGKNQAEIDFYKYYKEATSSIGIQYPDTFKEYSEFCDERMAEVMGRMSQMKNRDAIDYFKRKTVQAIGMNKFNYVWQIKKRGQALDSDPDYNEYFNSLDLNDPEVVKDYLPRMILVKKDMYSDTIPEVIRKIAATRELQPNKDAGDSLIFKDITNIILDAEITTQQEADALTEAVNDVVADEETKAKYLGLIEKACTLFEGADAIDFEIIDRDGKTVKLSDFKGKAVYVDFWATWCLPCCMEIPFMEKIAAKYANEKRIACISVSFDKSIEDWNEKLEMDKPQWPQYRAADGGKSIMKDYGFRGIPRFMLFDKEGKIVSPSAPRPSDSAALTELIDKVINK
ncbi:MAG: redoxin family protein [Bacteroidales bacterium]|nr:redoxin family protein [Candidatus Cacconaster equi]